MILWIYCLCKNVCWHFENKHALHVRVYESWKRWAFTALHVMQTRYSDEYVRPSVCPSVCHTNKLWQNGKKICPDFYTIRKIILLRRRILLRSLLRRRMLGDPFYLNSFGSTGSGRWSKIADFEPIIARSASAVTPSKKFQLTLTGSPLRAFQRA